jgi:hypothetical protein
MAVTYKIKTGVLTTTLTTAILTASTATRIEIQVLRYSVSSAGGSITASILDTSTTIPGSLLQDTYIDKDNPIELNGLRLEADDVLRSGYGAAATGAEYYIAYTEHT